MVYSAAVRRASSTAAGPGARPDAEPGLLERLAARLLRRGAAPAAPAAPGDARWRAIRRVRVRTVAASAGAGALGVLLLHVPRHLAPGAFGGWTVTVALGGVAIEVPLLWTLYGLGLAVVEIGGLVLLHIRAVRAVAGACGFPDPRDPDRDLHLRSLVAISVEREPRSELALGLNPWQGYSRLRIALIFLLARAKATLSNLVVKMLVRRVLGRYAVRLLVDLAGMPVMAAWNAYAADRLVRDATARILAPELVRHCVVELQRRHADRPAFAALLYDVLQFVAVGRRAFHENHYLLSLSLLRAFDVPVRPAHEVAPDFPARLARLDPELRRDLVALVVVGLILDGRLTWPERRALRVLEAAGILRWSPDEIRAMATDFMRGQGPALVRRLFDAAP
jgi:hypothetical protein